MYELLAGQKPFTGETAVKVLFQHLEGGAEPLTSIVPDVTPQLEDAGGHAHGQGARPAARRRRRSARMTILAALRRPGRAASADACRASTPSSQLGTRAGMLRHPLRGRAAAAGAAWTASSRPLKYRALTDDETQAMVREILDHGAAGGARPARRGGPLLLRPRDRPVPHQRLPQHRRGMSAICRVHPRQVPALATLGLPSVLDAVHQPRLRPRARHRRHRHCGKSTTLAAIIHEINEPAPRPSSRSRIRSSSCTRARTARSSSAKSGATRALVRRRAALRAARRIRT